MNKSNKVRTGFAAFVAFMCAASTASAQEAAAVGPVEEIGSSSFVVLGQTFHVRRAWAGVRPSIGDLVVVTGARFKDGSLSLTTLTHVRSDYVPGSSQVYLRGVVAKSDVLRGEVQIGGVLVQTAQALVNRPSAPSVGEEVELIGIQAAPGGVVWATKIQTLAPVATQGIEGTGRAISKQGIEGTGRSVSKQGIEGTGRALAAQGIEGTGKSVSVQGIEGTGRALSAQGIEGTGRSVSKQGIEGTGRTLTAQGIEGTGKSVSLQGIEGTGRALSTQSIEGTGRAISKQGIEGTGRVVSAEGIEGTGKSF